MSDQHAAPTGTTNERAARLRWAQSVAQAERTQARPARDARPQHPSRAPAQPPRQFVVVSENAGDFGAEVAATCTPAVRVCPGAM